MPYSYIWISYPDTGILKCGHIQGGPQKMQKLNEYPTAKSVNYEFIRAWHNWKTSNIAALIFDVL